MLTYYESCLMEEYITQYLKMSNVPINPFSVICVLNLEGLIDEAKMKSFIEERKENIK